MDCSQVLHRLGAEDWLRKIIKARVFSFILSYIALISWIRNIKRNSLIFFLQGLSLVLSSYNGEDILISFGGYNGRYNNEVNGNLLLL